MREFGILILFQECVKREMSYVVLVFLRFIRNPYDSCRFKISNAKISKALSFYLLIRTLYGLVF